MSTTKVEWFSWQMLVAIFIISIILGTGLTIGDALGWSFLKLVGMTDIY